jgi:hypothetical protein
MFGWGRTKVSEGTLKEHPVPGGIKEFHFYGQQDPIKHEADDTRNAFSTIGRVPNRM